MSEALLNIRQIMLLNIHFQYVHLPETTQATTYKKGS